MVAAPARLLNNLRPHGSRPSCNPKVNLKIGGYTDNTGGNATKVKLSQLRADSVLASLVIGLDKARLAAEATVRRK